MSHLCLFSTFMVLGTLATHDPSTRVIGGRPAFEGQFPFAAAIHVQTKDSRFFCGGTLFGPEWIITSGHCVYNALIFTVQLGSNYLESEDVNRLTLASSTYVLHPDFNPETIENDVGMIRLRMPVVYNDYIKTVQIEKYDLPDNFYVLVMGWGQTSDDYPELSNELVYVALTTISNEECQGFYGDQITDYMVCVNGNFNEGTCTGDNGSGLVMTLGKYYVLVGVSSFISGNGCESTNPSGYTRINPYYDWINNVTSSKVGK